MTVFAANVARLACASTLLFALPSCGIAHEWIESEGALSVPIEKVARTESTVHNGTIDVHGTPSKLEVITVRYRVRAGGYDIPDAQDCMSNVEILHDTADDGALKLGWRFAGEKRDTWAAIVNFTIEQPEAMPATAMSHNGTVSIGGVKATCHAETHNGHIRIERVENDVHAVSQNGNITVRGARKIEARTHNGRIRVDTKASDLSLSSHNGGVTAELRSDEPVRASIVTHNGPVAIELYGKCPVEIEASGDNADIHVGRGFDDVHQEDGKAWMKRGHNGDKIGITTHNGRISIRTM